MAALLAVFEVLLFVIACTAAEEPSYWVGGHCTGQGDLVFLIDESNSIDHEDFRKQLQFVNDIISHFELSRDYVHIGVMSFGRDVNTIIGLGAYYQEGEMRRRILDYSNVRGRDNEYTRTDLALDSCRASMDRVGRHGAPHIAIIITDGEPNIPNHTDRDARRVTMESADLLKRDGVKLFAIGVSSKANQDQLEEMASGRGRDYVHFVNSYSVISYIEQQLSREFCYAMMEEHDAGSYRNSGPAFDYNDDQNVADQY